MNIYEQANPEDKDCNIDVINQSKDVKSCKSGIQVTEGDHIKLLFYRNFICSVPCSGSCCNI